VLHKVAIILKKEYTVWQIRYWATGNNNPVKKWIDKLSKEQYKSVDKEIALLKQLGNELDLPHSRALGKGIFELRERRYGLRIYYCFTGKQIIILLAAGDKSNQTRDIRLARERADTIEEL